MHHIRTSAFALFVAASSISAANAKDFFVQAILPGPVVAPALAPISISGSGTVSTGGTTGGTTGGSTGGSSGTTSGSSTTTSTETKTPTETAGKWLSAPAKTVTTTASAATTSTSSITVTGTPFKSFGALMSSGQVKSGDRIFLLDGYHGPIRIDDALFTASVLVAPLPGSTAQVDSILINNSSNLTFKDLKVWATSVNAGNGAMIRSYASAHDLAFIGLDVRSVFDSTAYANWSATSWSANKRNGFLLDGANITVQGTRMTGVYHGLVALAPNTLLENNIVDGFSGDGMRAVGDDSIVRGNQIQNCVSINSNHPDAFQSYSVGPGGKPGTGTLHNLVVENNRIFESVGTPMALTCRLQGIGMFDGMYDNVRIENNTIVVSAYHGITVSGALNSVIRQNTVVNTDGQAGKNPWIRIGAHKNGTPPQNVQIVNNFATNITATADPTRNIVVASNMRARAAATEFVNFGGRNLALLQSSIATDAGDPAKTTTTDMVGTKRWKGKGPDVGAYESN